jgi:multidrug transporter EmrE-like cation transporter
MEVKKLGYLCVALTIALTVYGQLVIKWQVHRLQDSALADASRLAFYGHMLLNPWVISGFTAAFGASLTWMAALTRLELSKAYPFMALNFVIVTFVALPLFDEAITPPRLIGLALIVLGLIISSQG